MMAWLALVEFSASAVQGADSLKWGLYGVAEQKASGAQGFIMALGLFWDIATGLYLEHPMASAFLIEPYCIFLPGVHFLTL